VTPVSAAASVAWPTVMPGTSVIIPAVRAEGRRATRRAVRRGEGVRAEGRRATRRAVRRGEGVRAEGRRATRRAVTWSGSRAQPRVARDEGAIFRLTSAAE